MTDLEVSASTSLPTSTHSLTPDATGTPHIVNIGTRKSQLARIQTDIVVDALKKSWPETQCRVHAISTMGDKNQKTALHEFGAKNLWTFELEAMLRQGDIDFIVHSLKGSKSIHHNVPLSGLYPLLIPLLLAKTSQPSSRLTLRSAPSWRAKTPAML